MGIFGKSRAEKEDEARQIQQAQASRRQYDGVVRPRFVDQFRGWLDELEQARAASGALVLTDEILTRVGGAPQLEGDGLVRSHTIEFAAYARSYTSGVVQQRFASNGQFWRSVANYMTQIYG